MLTRQEFINQLENLNWNFFEKKYPSIAFFVRCSIDYYYVEAIAQGKINSKNDPIMKAAGEAIKTGLLYIPYVGEILYMIAEIGGIDLSAIKSISDSGIARHRLYEWIDYINAIYTKNNFEINDLPELNQKFINATKRLINARPKCTSPTSDCSKEHSQYIARTSLMKESQVSLYDIYYNYCINDTVFQTWLQGVTNYNQTDNPDIEEVQASFSNSTLLLLIGIGLIFSKKL